MCIRDRFCPELIETEPIAELVNLTKTKDVQAYHHRDLAFNVIYRCRLHIPEDLAIGRSVSIGYGTQKKTRWQGSEAEILAQINKELSTIAS